MWEVRSQRRQMEPLRTGWLAYRANQKMWLEIIPGRYARVTRGKVLNVKLKKRSRINTLHNRRPLKFLSRSVSGVHRGLGCSCPLQPYWGPSRSPAVRENRAPVSNTVPELAKHIAQCTPVGYFQVLLLSSLSDTTLLFSACCYTEADTMRTLQPLMDFHSGVCRSTLDWGWGLGCFFVGKCWPFVYGFAPQPSFLYVGIWRDVNRCIHCYVPRT